jgi:MoxR-like ATPase
MKVKSGQAVIDAIKLAYAAGKPVLLEGRHGVGKSQLIEQAADELGISCITRDLSLMEPPDLIGLPVQDNGKTRYSPPSFLPDSGKGLLVFEELNRSEKYMMAPCLQLLTARTLNDYNLPKGWLTVAAINPASDGYDTSQLDPALLSRFIRIEIVPCVKSWLSWGSDAGIHPSVLKFVSQTPDIFAAAESNPRSWAYVSDVLKAYQAIGLTDENLLVVTLAGVIGDSLATAFVQASLREEESIPAEVILKEYEKARTVVRQWVKVKRMDLLNSTVHGVRVALQNVDTAANVASGATLSRNLGLFIDDLPAELGKNLKKAAKVAGAIQ